MGKFRSDRLLELRTAHGLSQEQLARLTGSTQPSINRLEAGGTGRPRNLVELARELQTTPDYLLGETDDPGLRLTDRRIPWRGAEPDPRRDADLVEIDQIDLRYGLGATYVDVHVESEKRVFSRSWLSQFTKAAPDQLFWALAEGGSMANTIMSGETVLIDRSQKIPRVSGGIWALTIGELGMIKRLHVPGKGRIQWLSDSGLEPPIEPTEDDEQMIIGRVIAVVRRL